MVLAGDRAQRQYLMMGPFTLEYFLGERILRWTMGPADRPVSMPPPIDMLWPGYSSVAAYNAAFRGEDCACFIDEDYLGGYTAFSHTLLAHSQPVDPVMSLSYLLIISSPHLLSLLISIFLF